MKMSETCIFSIFEEPGSEATDVSTITFFLVCYFMVKVWSKCSTRHL